MAASFMRRTLTHHTNQNFARRSGRCITMMSDFTFILLYGGILAMFTLIRTHLYLLSNSERETWTTIMLTVQGLLGPYLYI